MTREHIKSIITQDLFTFMDLGDANKLADSVLDDVITDIEETAGDIPNSSDVRIALSRVIMKKFEIE